jgi:predicted DNA-binding transcriptional regulator YafY
MAKKRKSPAKPAIPVATVTVGRFVRLYRMVKLLAGGTQTRETLARRLRLDARGFYRDLDLLRSSGVSISLAAARYTLEQDTNDALGLLPFPDPRLTLGAAQTLAKGRSPAHRALAETISHIVPTR